MTSPIAKMIVALISTVTGFAGEVITYGLVAGTARVWVMLGIGLLTAIGNVLGVYLVPNTPATPFDKLRFGRLYHRPPSPPPTAP